MAFPKYAGDEDTVAQLLGISKLDELFSSGTRAITVRSKAPKTERKRVGGRDQPKAPSKTRDRNNEANSNFHPRKINKHK